MNLPGQINNQNDNVEKINGKILLAVVGPNFPKGHEPFALLQFDSKKIDNDFDDVKDGANRLTNSKYLTLLNLFKNNRQGV